MNKVIREKVFLTENFVYPVNTILPIIHTLYFTHPNPQGNLHELGSGQRPQIRQFSLTYLYENKVKTKVSQLYISDSIC